MNEQIGRFDTILSLLKDLVINPFIEINLERIFFRNVLVQERLIDFDEFDKTIALTHSTASTHMPRSIFNYLQEVFFDHLCWQPRPEGSEIETSSTIVPLQSCRCNGGPSLGLPDLSF